MEVEGGEAGKRKRKRKERGRLGVRLERNEELVEILLPSSVRVMRPTPRAVVVRREVHRTMQRMKVRVEPKRVEEEAEGQGR